MITRPATIGTSSAQVVSAISAAIPNPTVSTPSVTMNHSNAPAPSASRPNTANVSRHPRCRRRPCPGVSHEVHEPADRVADERHYDGCDDQRRQDVSRVSLRITATSFLGLDHRVAAAGCRGVGPGQAWSRSGSVIPGRLTDRGRRPLRQPSEEMPNASVPGQIGMRCLVAAGRQAAGQAPAGNPPAVQGKGLTGNSGLRSRSGGGGQSPGRESLFAVPGGAIGLLRPPAIPAYRGNGEVPFAAAPPPDPWRRAGRHREGIWSCLLPRQFPRLSVPPVPVGERHGAATGSVAGWGRPCASAPRPGWCWHFWAK